MKFSKILLIIGIVAFISAFTMSTTFATSSEKLTQYKSSFYSSADKKVSTIKYTLKSNNEKCKELYNINIKKPYQKNYKIKSVHIRYSVHDNKTGKFKNYIYKNYTVNNKANFIIKNKMYRDNSFDKLIVNYQTNDKIKSESINPYYSKYKLRINTLWSSIKSNAKSFQKMYINNNFALVKYQHIKVLTKSKNYKIKSVKFSLINLKNNKSFYKTFKGYGKNNFKVQLYNNVFVNNIKVYYY